MNPRSTAGTAAGLLSLALAAAAPAAALAGPTVTVRVEGQSGTLLERTAVTLPDTPPPVASCNAGTAAAAIEEATKGNWDRNAFTAQILQETHAYPAPEYWAEWIDDGTGYARGGGICNDTLKAGDEVLMLVDRAVAPNYEPTVLPLDLEGLPAQAQAGTDMTVTVVEYRSATGGTGEGERTPIAGATVSGGGVTATSDAAGHATLRFDQPGQVVVKATKAGDAPSAGEPISVTAAPVVASPPPAPDKTAPLAQVAGIKPFQKFSRKRAPRALEGAVADDPSGIAAVKLSLTRRYRGECSAYSGRSEEFVQRRCGVVYAFKIGDRADWSYLLPARLKPGRYDLEVTAVDRAGNRGVTERVFTVR